MAATQSVKGDTMQWPFLVTVVELSTIEPGVTVNVAHNGPTGAAVWKVDHEVTTRAASRDVIEVNHLRASDSTANNTAAIAVDTTPLGNLSGAVVRLYFWFQEQAAGGINGDTSQTP